MKSMKGKSFGTLGTRKQKKATPKEVFRQVYNRPKEKAFSDIDNLTWTASGYPQKHNSYELSKAALAVYPVLCCEADFEKDEAFKISQKNIARFAGVSENSVRNALKELENAGLLIKKRLQKAPAISTSTSGLLLQTHTGQGQTVWRSNLFYTCIIDNGIWANLPLEPRPSIYS